MERASEKSHAGTLIQKQILYTYSICVTRSPIYLMRQSISVFLFYTEIGLAESVVYSTGLTANAEVATVLGSISASSDTVESEGWQMKQC
jgi:hypothetical protein